MADPNPIFGEFFKAKAVTDEQVNAAVAAHQAKPETDAHPLADSYVLDLYAAVVAHIPSLLVLCDVHARGSDKRQAVRTAILLARTRKA